MIIQTVSELRQPNNSVRDISLRIVNIMKTSQVNSRCSCVLTSIWSCLNCEVLNFYCDVKRIERVSIHESAAFSEIVLNG